MTRYELLDRIGVGGMAEIFRGKAVAAGGFEKPVAIKRILPHLSQDKRFVELLIAEAKVLSLLKHRNIVQIFDVGLGDDGQYFLVMEYVDGKDLGAVQRAFEARRRRMPFDLALHICAEICEALEHAHTARAPDGKPMSLVHRDVSPSNVLLSRAGEIKLTDFGIAKRAEQEATGHGAVRGKFAYISPEQARNEHIDPRSDVFSVAILLWELVTNRRLFSGLGDLEALRAVREARVPRPIEVDPELSPELDALLMSALDRDLTKRPTAEQLSSKLRSMRYALDITVGDPATELAKIIETADEVQRESARMVAQQAPPSMAGISLPGLPARTTSGFEQPEYTEATVIRIRTADEFNARDVDGGMARARAVIDRFDDEETRQAQLSGDQLRLLRGGRDESSDLSLLSPAPAPLPGVGPAGGRGAPAGPRPRRPTDEPTTARPPLFTGDVPTIAGKGLDDLPPNQRFDSDESTRLVARSRDRRTPMPMRAVPATRPPPMPPAMPGLPPPTDSGPIPGTVHSRNPQRSRGPTPGPPLGSAGMPGLPPQRPFNEPLSQSYSQSARGPSGAPQMPLGAPPETPPPQPSMGMGPGMPSPVPQPMPMPMPMPPGLQPAPMSLPPGMQPGMAIAGARPMPQPMPMPQVPGMQPGMPSGVTPGVPGMPGMQGMPPGVPGMQPGMPGMQPGMPGMQPGMPGMQPGMPAGVAGSYGGGWPPGNGPQIPARGASPAPQDLFDPRSSYVSRPSTTGIGGRARKPALKPWMLVVGALVMAALAFAVTRAFLS